MRADTLSHSDRSLPALRTLLLVLGLCAPLLIYADTVRSLIAIWNSSETFSHQYIILPLSLWLAWRERARLRQLRLQPCVPALAALMLCGLAWLLGTLADVQVVRQYGFVALCICSAVALLGWPIARVLAFPLLFLLLAVPFGEIFIDPLINVTADFTVAALQMTGIPVLREGNTFAIPSGRWSVVEACSGVRYLIASVTLGFLYAHLTYRSWRRKAAFLAVSIVVPIIANGLRAYMIVMIGHLSGMRLAVGVDHLIYGWLFFGLVTFILFRIGARWVEDAPEIAPAAATTGTLHDQRISPAWLRTLVLAIACSAVWPAYAWYMAHTDNPAPIRLQPVPGQWTGIPAFSAWQPAFSPARAEAVYYFEGAGEHHDQRVGLAMRYYRSQRQGATLVSSVNRTLGEKDNTWVRLDSTVRDEPLAGRTLAVREDIIKGAGPSLVIWRWYWIDRRFVENDYLAKLFQTRSRLAMAGDDGAALFAFAPFDEQPETARVALRAYLGQNLPAIQGMLEDTAKRGPDGQ